MFFISIHGVVLEKIVSQVGTFISPKCGAFSSSARISENGNNLHM
jgi:hypothetical protein